MTSTTNPTQNSTKTLSSISVSPANPSLAVNATSQLHAMGSYSDGSSTDLTSSVTWASSNTADATVSTTGVVTGMAAGSASITATLNGVSGSAKVTVVPGTVTVNSITVSPATVSLAPGATQQLAVNASYSNGTTGALASGIAWTSSNSAVATVNSTGLATGVAAGSATITASADGQTANSTVTVTAAAKTVTAISISPATATINTGSTQQFSVMATYSDGSSGTLTSGVTWTSSNAGVATISAAGLAQSVAAGSATITASAAGLTTSAALTVSAAAKTITSIAVTPATASISTGSTQQFVAMATYSDGTTANITGSSNWASSNSAVATVSAAGVASGVGAGSATITASAGGQSGGAALAVTAATITTIAITPANPTFASGSTQQFTATATYNNGTTGNVTSSVTWSSSNSAVATISASGLATGAGSGTTTISAIESGVTGSTVATINVATITSIAVTPANPTISAGATQQFTATATYNTGKTGDVTSSVTWTSSNSSVATISTAGLATGDSSGNTTVSASENGITGSTTATVTTGATGTTNITTWHVDANRSGLNANESVLTPTNVATSSFGKKFSYLVDGYVYGSPLIMSNVSIAGGTHDVLFVATEHDSVYAFDADNYGSGAPLWKVSLLQSGETPLTGGPIQPYEGVTSTPVIDPATGTLYVVSAQTSSGGSTFRISALDITTGAEKFGGPVTINASVAATNSASVNGVQTLNTSCIQRAALLLANGNLYIGFGGCHSGWLLAYSASSLKQVGVFNSSTKLNGEGTYASAGGVWMGGGGPVADSSGNVYITTGNGPWDGQTAFADSILKFGPTPQAGANGSMQPIDYFTPNDYQYMDCNDADLAAGGLLLIPGSTTLIAGGKTSTMYVVDSASLGHESANDTGAIQEQVWGSGLTDGGTYQSSCQDSTGTNYANITSYEIFGTSAYFNGAVYLGVTPTSSSAPGGVRQFLYNGKLTPAGDSANYQAQGTRGTSPFISSNGGNDGIVWMIDQGNPLQNTSGAAPSSAVLRAYDAANYPTEIYNSSANSADAAGYGIKFSSPVVANGNVYVSTGHDLTTVANPQGEIDVYGLK